VEDTNREEAREEVEEEACIIIIIIIICVVFLFYLRLSASTIHVLVLAVWSFLVSFYKTKGNTHKSRDTKKKLRVVPAASKCRRR